MAKTVYVNKAGNDSNDGLTLATAKLTIAGANAIAVATDTVSIGVGTWSETLQLSKVNDCIYQGAGMFLTAIQGDIYNSGITSSKVNDMKIIFATNLPRLTATTVTWNNVYLDGTNTSSGTNAYIAYVIANATNKFTGCIFYKCTNTGGAGLFPINGANGILKIYNCIFYKSNAVATDYFVYDYSGANNGLSFKNCIFHSVAGSSRIVAGGGFVHEYNCFYASTLLFLTTALNATEFEADPLFVDPEGGDFRLQSSSPCIGKGTNDLP